MIRLAWFLCLALVSIDAGKLHTPLERPSMSSKPDLFGSALAAEGVTGRLADLARSIYSQESGGGRNTKTSNRGARGGMQILEGTFGEVADKDWSIDDPMHNARAGIRYLKKLDRMSGGDPALTAAGYYGGPGGLEKARRGIAVSDPKNPGAPNTLEYGQQVVSRLADEPPAPLMAAAPAALPEGAALQGAAGPAPVVIPPEMLARLSAPAASQYEAGGPDAWQEFLKSMPGRAQPVNVADIDYGNPRTATRMPEFQLTPTPNRKPNFEAFGSWTGRAA